MRKGSKHGVFLGPTLIHAKNRILVKEPEQRTTGTFHDCKWMRFLSLYIERKDSSEIG